MNAIVRLCLGLALVFLAAAPALAQPMMPFDEATPEVRRVAAAEALKQNQAVALLYARGLCCGSCAIGVRKKVSPLPFVDRERFADGVSLDPEHQLVTVALKEGATADPKLLAQAIKDAGYDPVRMFALSDGKLDTTELEQPK